MNDGLHAAIAEAISGAWSYLSGDEYDASNIIDAADAAVRAWLLLPPSEEEIAAEFRKWHSTAAPEYAPIRLFAFAAGFRASRAVLVRPPEATQ